MGLLLAVDANAVDEEANGLEGCARTGAVMPPTGSKGLGAYTSATGDGDGAGAGAPSESESESAAPVSRVSRCLRLTTAASNHGWRMCVEGAHVWQEAI